MTTMMMMTMTTTMMMTMMMTMTMTTMMTMTYTSSTFYNRHHEAEPPQPPARPLVSRGRASTSLLAPGGLGCWPPGGPGPLAPPGLVGAGQAYGA